MDTETRARIVEETGKVMGDLIKVIALRPKRTKSPAPPFSEVTKTAPKTEDEGKISHEPEKPPILPSESHLKPPLAVKERKGLDQETLAYQEDRALGEVYLLEDHLKAGCRECGEEADCCWKHADKLARYAHETMSMTTDQFWSNLYDLAIEIKEKTHPEDVKAGTYASEYPKYAVRVSELRRPLQQKAMQRAKPVLTLEEAKRIAAEEAMKQVEASYKD